MSREIVQYDYNDKEKECIFFLLLMSIKSAHVADLNVVVIAVVIAGFRLNFLYSICAFFSACHFSLDIFRLRAQIMRANYPVKNMEQHRIYTYKYICSDDDDDKCIYGKYEMNDIASRIYDMLILNLPFERM